MEVSGQSGSSSLRVWVELTGGVQAVSDEGVFGYPKRYICACPRFQSRHWQGKTVQTKNQ